MTTPEGIEERVYELLEKHVHAEPDGENIKHEFHPLRREIHEDMVALLHQELQKALTVQAIQIREEEANEYNKIIERELQKAREQRARRNAVIKEYKDEGVMFVLKVEDGKTYEASMPIPKWAEVGKLTLRDQSELDQPTPTN